MSLSEGLQTILSASGGLYEEMRHDHHRPSPEDLILHTTVLLMNYLEFL